MLHGPSYGYGPVNCSGQIWIRTLQYLSFHLPRFKHTRIVSSGRCRRRNVKKDLLIASSKVEIMEIKKRRMKWECLVLMLPVSASFCCSDSSMLRVVVFVQIGLMYLSA